MTRKIWSRFHTLGQDPQCDDCAVIYAGPPYYTFPPEACQLVIDEVEVPHPCTGNLCPDCADYLEPDDPNDPRRTSLAGA